ncbi:MAG: capsule assembly Wzi family protein [Pelosinus sp.]|nr:capsule assembly Wzi family protein [Pelosinus sp.]
MNKKLLVAAVMAAMTLSATSVFASPITFSGDGYLEYNNTQAGWQPGNGFDARLRLNIDGNIDDNLRAHARLVQENNLSTTYAANVARFDEAYIAGKFGNLDLQVGKDDLFTGKGLLIDDHQFSGVKASTNVEGLNLGGFYGKDKDNKKTSTIDLKTSFDGVNLGANFVTFDANHYYGVNADTKLADATLSAEYVKNSTNEAKGYIAGVTMGNYTVSYRDIENGALTPYSTNGNYDNSKGFKVSAHYNLGKNSSVTLYQDLAKDQNDVQKHRTNVEWDYNF